MVIQAAAADDHIAAVAQYQRFIKQHWKTLNLQQKKSRSSNGSSAGIGLAIARELSKEGAGSFLGETIV